MYHTLGWHFVHQYALAGNLYYITQPASFSNRAFNHTLYVSTFLAGFFPWSVLVIGGAIDTVTPLAPERADSAGGASALGVGGHGVHLLQPGAVQGRSLRLSRGARLLSPGRASLDERQRVAARYRRGPRQYVRAVVRRHAGSGTGRRQRGWRVHAVRPRARSSGRCHRHSHQSRGGRGRAGRGDLQTARRVAHAVYVPARRAARDLCMRCGHRSACS